MKIGFFSEAGYNGKVPRNIPMRTDQAWVCALNATHHSLSEVIVNGCEEKYDIGIVIIPKNNPQFDVNKLKQYCDKIAVMQEGRLHQCSTPQDLLARPMTPFVGKFVFQNNVVKINCNSRPSGRGMLIHLLL